MLQLLKRGNHTTERAAIAIDGDYASVAVVDQRNNSKPVLRASSFYRSVAGQGTSVQDLSSLRIRQAPVSCVLEHGDYQMQLVETPNVPEAELRQAVAWRIKDLVDFPLDELTVDLFHLPKHSTASARAIAYAVTSRNVTIEENVTAARALVSQPVSVVDVPELCLRNIATLLPDDEHGAAFLHFTDTDGYLVITRKGELHVVRQVPSGRRVFTENADDSFFVNERAAGIALEIQRSLDYYESHYDYRPIQKLFLGPGAGLDVLPQALNENLGLEVVPLDLDDLFEIKGELTDEDRGRCLIAAGAALRPDTLVGKNDDVPQTVNLLTPDERLSMQEFPARFQAKAAGILIAVMTLIAMFADFRVASIEDEMQVAELQEAAAVERLANLRATIDAEMGGQSWQDQLDDALGELQKRQAILTLVQGSTLGETRGFSPQLRALSRQHIEGIWLTYITLSAGGDQTRIEGQTIGAELVPMYVQNLIDEGPFARQRFNQFEIDNPIDNTSGSLFFSMDSAPVSETAQGGRR
ncbi:MAG: hypothetical protein AAF917_11805 [Pseudomonadota bacterium]